jgi:hypothetical protein
MQSNVSFTGMEANLPGQNIGKLSPFTDKIASSPRPLEQLRLAYYDVLIAQILVNPAVRFVALAFLLARVSTSC